MCCLESWRLEVQDPGVGRAGSSRGLSPRWADRLLAPSSCGLSLCVLTLVSLFDLIYLFVAVLGLCCCVGYSLVVASRATLAAMQGLLLEVASPVVGHRL